MSDIIGELYETVIERKQSMVEGSYTCYLFREGLDKILKKCGEESAEVIIAAKNDNKNDLVCEIADLYYHITVLMAEKGIIPQELHDELAKRSQKSGNLKTFHKTDKNS